MADKSAEDKGYRREKIFEAGQAALNFSHGIKNIMQALAGSREVVDYSIRHDNLQNAKKGWAILDRNLGKLHRFALNMLSFSRQAKPVFDNCRPGGIIELVVESLRSECESRNVRVEIDTDRNMPVIRADSGQIHDMLLNLVINAIEAVPADSGIVNIAARADSTNHAAVLTVTDNGPGIEDMENLFMPFYSTKAKAGTGLGLAIVKKTVTEHNGRIDVHSTSAGTTFTVTLPVEQTAE